MVRSLWSGVAGLKTHQTEMDVISNNISNVNTTAYKSQQMNFTDLLYQAKKSATAATATRTGTNATQVGLGARTGAIMTMIGAQGSVQTTNNAFDLSITGDSFFTVADADHIWYTRDGSFTIDGTGYLVNQNQGLYVLGWRSADGFTVDTTGNLQNLQLISDDNKTLEGEATTAVTFSGNLDRYDSQLSTDEGRVVAIEVYGTDGERYTIKYSFTDAGDDIATTFAATVTGVMDANGNAIDYTDNVGTVNLIYNAANGTFTSANGNENGIVAFAFGGNVGTINVDFSSTTSYAAKNNTSTVTAARGDINGNNEGYPEGAMTGVTIGTDGTITASYGNGQFRIIGQLAVAEFINATGLQLDGNNLYSATGNSGDPQYMVVTADGGYMSSGTLEMSNVDLATEFTNMITTQRGFQANSRVITVTDTLLEELKNLKR